MTEVEKFNKELSEKPYGWHDKDNVLHEKLVKEEFQKYYKMPTLEQMKKNNHAICWEQCEIERDFFQKHKYSFRTVFVVLNNGESKPGHSFLIYKDKDKYIWFEASWSDMKGLKSYNSLKELFADIKNNFYKFIKTNDFDKEKLEFYAYEAPRREITCEEFYKNAMYFGEKMTENYQF